MRTWAIGSLLAASVPVACGGSSGSPGAEIDASSCPSLACPMSGADGSDTSSDDTSVSDVRVGDRDGDAAADAAVQPDGPPGDARSDGPAVPPDGAVGAPCRIGNDCASHYCAGPVAPICTCPAGSCRSDSDCATDGGNLICQSLCGGTCTRACLPGCTDSSCPEGTQCGAGHRCEPRVCAGAGDCPAQFDCIQSACARRSCQRDSDCTPGDYCVDAACSTQLGTCSVLAG